jgi:UDP-N-acetylmuramate--alanine ligase
MLNLELDHTDFFRDLSELRASFVSAAALAERAVLVSADDENLHEISVSGVPVLTFGKNERADYRYEIVAENAGKCSISIYYKGNKLTECQLAIAGKFNAANAAAAIAASHIAGVDAGVASAAIAAFEGIPRRLEKIAAGSAGALFYDYAHHPSEIKATIGALRDMGYGRIGVIFSPHTYSRTAALWRGFSEALALADECVVTDIYAAREDPIPAVDSSRLAASVRGSGGNAVYRRASFAAEYMLGRNVDAIVIMGAGDTERVRRDMLSLFYRDS